MILKKEFYFIRHGQTDHNISPEEKIDLPAHIALNSTGLTQAQGIEPNFMNQVLKGINQALEGKGPVLMVAHGGVHWALCCFLGVECEWVINNCVPVYFTVENEKWSARKLI